ncbi:hypothetical protein CBA19CS11_27780 [Caballeronia novacaledonica]|uniref:hypothetical protein n=1 Tax=Caballeronia novacaledonica TaxID=1544861 RepID=UPI001EE30822|nr:hypothetical protein [Caballeronia novacaledonica]GJH12716.1 hypothetical protein CBA19CS11_27780 [Caballeronia novacaledonica]
MAYLGQFRDIVYANEKREPRVATYRLVLLEEKPTAAVVIHLHREHHAGTVRLAREQELDVVIGRIVGRELRGIRVDRTRVVVETDRRFTEYSLDFNAADLPSTRPVGEPWKPPVVAVESRDIVGGSLPVFVDGKCAPRRRVAVASSEAPAQMSPGSAL